MPLSSVRSYSSYCNCGGHARKNGWLNPHLEYCPHYTEYKTVHRNVWVFTGGRSYANTAVVLQALESLLPVPQLRVVTGDCPTGLDSITEWCCEELEVEYDKYPADWAKYGKSAGPIRNRNMLLWECPVEVFAFPGGKGTADCVRQARSYGIPIKEFK